MSCQIVRESLSARLGGEHEPVPAAEADAHLGRCTGCLGGSHFSGGDHPRTPPGRRPGGRARLNPLGSHAA
ncbi:hypothetical protein [Lentzea guizhouensis]|uniref:hypothetical protein n=1 Tax=Lentzea guizhouensis TaxID=1586287 RepID=UPI0012B69CE3|nr:hypothetical protein [Lentzea guizhouensis]